MLLNKRGFSMHNFPGSEFRDYSAQRWAERHFHLDNIVREDFLSTIDIEDLAGGYEFEPVSDEVQLP
jgi:hypothetical protein